MSAPAVRYFNAVHTLMRVPVSKRDAKWWASVRHFRDETLEILRGPVDPRVLRILLNVPRWLAVDPQWRAAVWAGALQEVEAWSVRLDAAYLRYVIEQQTYGLTGTA